MTEIKKTSKKKKDVILSDVSGCGFTPNNFNMNDKILKKITFNFQMALTYSGEELFEIFNKYKESINYECFNNKSTSENTSFSRQLLKLLSEFLSFSMLENIKEERNCDLFCGVPFCLNKLKNNLNLKIKLSNQSELSNFCSKDCFNIYNHYSKLGEYINDLIFKDYSKIYNLAHICRIFIEKEYFKQISSALFEALNPFKEDLILEKFIFKQLEKIDNN